MEYIYSLKNKILNYILSYVLTKIILVTYIQNFHKPFILVVSNCHFQRISDGIGSQLHVVKMFFTVRNR